MKNGKLKLDNSHWSKQRYQGYKESDIEWLREVPEHWKVSHVKRICKNVTDGAHTSPDISSNDYPFLTVVNLKNGVLDFKNCLYTSSSDYQKLVRNGCNPKVFDVLYSKDGTISESVVINEERNFVVGSSFIILSPIFKKCNSEHFSYLLSSNIMRFQASLYIKGASLPRISIFNVAKLFCVVPSLLEQKQIADYLDRKTAQIDRKIDLLNQKANKYEELKKSLINETVTRGLDKSVAMKDSGIEWIGKIPEHWEITFIVKTLSSLVDYRGRTPKKVDFEENGMLLVTAKNIKKGRIDYSLSEEFVDIDDVQSLLNRGKPEIGDVLFTTEAPLGEVANVDRLDFALAQRIIKFRGKSNIIDNYFMKYWLLSSNFQYSLQRNATGSTALGLKGSKVRLLNILVPPLTEQKAIARYLDEKTAHCDKIITTINQQIEKLKELRKTLINDVVTGKIKVTDD